MFVINQDLVRCRCEIASFLISFFSFLPSNMCCQVFSISICLGQISLLPGHFWAQIPGQLNLIRLKPQPHPQRSLCQVWFGSPGDLRWQGDCTVGARLAPCFVLSSLSLPLSWVPLLFRVWEEEWRKGHVSPVWECCFILGCPCSLYGCYQMTMLLLPSRLPLATQLKPACLPRGLFDSEDVHLRWRRGDHYIATPFFSHHLPTTNSLYSLLKRSQRQIKKSMDTWRPAGEWMFGVLCSHR